MLGARDPAEGGAPCCAGPQVVEQLASRRGQGLAGEFVAESLEKVTGGGGVLGGARLGGVVGHLCEQYYWVG